MNADPALIAPGAQALSSSTADAETHADRPGAPARRQLEAGEGYVFAGNARRWKVLRAGFWAMSLAAAGFGALLFGMVLERPDLPDLALDPSRPRPALTAAHSPGSRTRPSVYRRREEPELLHDLARNLDRMVASAHRSRRTSAPGRKLVSSRTVARL